MALNWAMLNSDRTPVPLPNESTIKTIDFGVEVILNIPDAPPSTSSSAGGSGGMKTLKEIGRMWLTDQRLIYVGPAFNASIDSLSIPLLSMVSTSFEQPYFGANYLSIEIRPSPGGGLTNGTKVEIRLKDRGIFEFVATLDKTRERLVYMKRATVNDEDTLPVYEAPSGSRPQAGPSSVSNTMDDGPPGYDA